jgi:hypothetical protein
MSKPDSDFWPVHTVKDRDVEAAIWEISTPDGPGFRVRISRVYRADDEWKYSNLFSEEALLRLSKVASDAYSWIVKHRNDAPRQGGLSEL